MIAFDLMTLGELLIRGQLAPGGVGSLSARDGATMLVTSRHSRLDRLSTADFIELAPIPDQALLPEAEVIHAATPALPFHLAAHRARPDSPLVALVPAPRAVTVSLLGQHLPALVPDHRRHFGRLVPCVSGAAMGTTTYFEDISRMLTHAPALLLQNLGVLAVGESSTILHQRLAWIESAADLYLEALAAGTPHPLSPMALQWLDEIGWG